MATPHIEANVGDIADIVLMPGDPLRAKFIAETYLSDAKLFNNIRGMLGYTGYYNDKKVSVMGSGMGMPSIGIYSYELFKFYNVNKIIRIGSCGALSDSLNIYDIVLVDNAYSDSSYTHIQNGSTDKLISASSNLNNKIEETAKESGINIIRGNNYSTDVFDPYRDNPNYDEPVDTYKCITAEMEAFALFHNARILNKEAACLLTVSDSSFKSEHISSTDREKSMITMIELALKSI
jgi:purine-nucleoside phosphorylase